MRRTSTGLGVFVFALAFVPKAVLASGHGRDGESDHAGYRTEIVVITPPRLLPAVLIVPPDAGFGWLDDSSTEATVRFDEDIIPTLTCQPPGLFRARGALLSSLR